MTNVYLEHPSEELLERFLLQKSDEVESEILEAHILACEPCVTRLEQLEQQISDLKAGLILLREEKIQEELNPKPSLLKRWFSIPVLSWAGAATAALAIGLVLAPQVLHRGNPASGGVVAERDLSVCVSSSGADASLAACRGSEDVSVPQNKPLDLHIDATDIADGPVAIQIVNGTGREVWKGEANVTDDRAEVKIPQLAAAGPHFLRVLSSQDSEAQLLREFRFEVK